MVDVNGDGIVGFVSSKRLGFGHCIPFATESVPFRTGQSPKRHYTLFDIIDG